MVCRNHGVVHTVKGAKVKGAGCGARCPDPILSEP